LLFIKLSLRFIPSNLFIFSSCQSCIEATNCGFCYTEEGNSAVNGSCLPYKETASSSIGRCNSTELPSDLVWADNFCPSSYSWMGLLGLVIYLMAFAPGNGDYLMYLK
jgi:SP family myo-inositol transporter-like MFS transporter 13